MAKLVTSGDKSEVVAIIMIMWHTECAIKYIT